VDVGPLVATWKTIAASFDVSMVSSIFNFFFSRKCGDVVAQRGASNLCLNENLVDLFS